MASRRPLPLVLPLLALAVLAGCVDAPTDVDAAVTDPAALPAAAGVLRFDGNGTLLPLPPVVGKAWYGLTGHQGAEPNLGITSSGALFATADEHVVRSRDRGQTWEVVWTFGLEDDGAPVDPFFNSDPMLWVDPLTDRVYADPMFPTLACTTLAWSDDEGETWTERHGTCHAPPMDHQKLGGGKPGPQAPPVAGRLYPSVLYQCYNMLLTTNCAQSYDGGLNFLPAQPVLNAMTDGCAGLNGMPSVGPDGTVAVGSSVDCEGPVLGLSQDSGMTWRVVHGPEDKGGTLNDPEIEWASDGTMFVLWSGDDFLPYLARSRDLGATWEGPWKVSPPGVNSTVFAAMVAGDDGKLGIAFLGTRDQASDPSDAGDEVRWHLHVVTTEDALADAPTFTGVQVTPDEDPVQVGCVWMRGFPGAPCRNMLDFIDAAVHPDGTFFVVYTEGCTEGCADVPGATPDDSRARDVAVARLDGWILRTAAADDPPADA